MALLLFVMSPVFAPALGVAPREVEATAIDGPSRGTAASAGVDDWTQEFPSPAPPALAYPRTVYDSRRDDLIAIGYYGTFQSWRYDVGSGVWTNLSPPSAPPNRYLPGIAYDSDSDRVVIFGGKDQAGTMLLDETWAYDVGNNTWSNRAPGTHPGPRVNTAMSYDADSDLIVLFGGCTGVTSCDSSNAGDTWTYDFETNTWTIKNPGGSPIAQGGHPLAYDTRRDRIVMHGAYCGGCWDTNTYAYDLDNNSWSNLKPSGIPAARYGASFGYDTLRDRFILYGGCKPSTTCGWNSETYVYDQGANSWTAVNPSTNPGQRSYAMMGYSPVADRAYIFGGGVNGAGATNHTWYYGGPAPQPPQVVATQPANGDTKVSLKVDVTVDFSQPMDAAATAGAITVSPPVGGASVAVSGARLTFTHTAPFDPIASYTVDISTAARSTSGFNLAAPYSFSFLTMPPAEKVDPQRIVFQVADPSIEVGQATEVTYEVYDAQGRPIGTKDSWEVSPKDVAKVEYQGNRKFSVTGLKPGVVSITVTAVGDTKSVKNSTAVEVVAAAAPPGPQAISAQTLALVLVPLAIGLALLLAALTVWRRKRRPPAPVYGDTYRIQAPGPAAGHVPAHPPAAPLPPHPPSGPDARSRAAARAARERTPR